MNENTIDTRIDDIRRLKRREAVLRAQLKELQADRAEVERDLLEDMFATGFYSKYGSDGAEAELLWHRELDKDLAASAFPYDKWPSAWTISAAKVKLLVGKDAYEDFMRETNDPYLKVDR